MNASHMTYEIKKIDVWSVVKIAFILYAILGLIIGLFYAVILTMLGGIISQLGELGGEFGQMTGFFTGAVGIVMAFFMALFYAVIGAIFTAIFVWLYNILAKLTGGIRFNLEGEKIAAVAVAPAEQSEADSEGMLGKSKYE
jgi:hypothetical protein